MKNIIAIDPGPKESAMLVLNDNNKIIRMRIYNNFCLKSSLESALFLLSSHIMIIEMIASYGMPVGKSVFDTCVWIGRFIEAWGGEYKLIYRRDIKLHLCNSSRAKDSNIRQALIDRFGRPGTKKNPGKLYGIKKDLWSALALAVYYADTNKTK